MAVALTNDTLNMTMPRHFSPEVMLRLSNERKRLAADPAANPMPADIASGNKFVFRAKPGSHRRIVHTLPMPPDEASYPGEPAQFQFELRRWKRLVAQPAFPELPRDKAGEAMTKRLEAVRDALGDTLIVFLTVRRHVECYYPTDNEVVADYLRGLVAAGKFPFDKVVETRGNLRIKAGDEIFPDTELGWRLARAYIAEHGIDKIEQVKE